MQQAGLPFLNGWQNFIGIAGTAAATLTGLMFVANTLISGMERQRSILNAGIDAFNTPTVVQFGMVLLIAGILSAPWQALLSLCLLLGLVGLWGGGYLIIVIRRMRHVPDYPVRWKDLLWYGIFPLIVYIVLVIAAVLLGTNPPLGMYVIGAVMALLLFIGIHNAWDLVTFLAIERSHLPD